METGPNEQLSRRKKILLVLAGCAVAASLATYGITRDTASEKPAPQPVTTQAPKTEEPAPAPNKYHEHKDIIATVFWVGEGADESNDYISNRSSYWMEDWVAAYGGVDNREPRCGYIPCKFVPLENPFYFALPYGDFDENGNPKPESELQRVPWYAGKLATDAFLLKNSWVQISRGDKIAYAQWEDVGPFGEDDIEYVFGTERPQEKRAGIDLSPAVADFLEMKDVTKVSWNFVDEEDVPEGPWRDTVTRSNPKY